MTKKTTNDKKNVSVSLICSLHVLVLFKKEYYKDHVFIESEKWLEFQTLIERKSLIIQLSNHLKKN